jgi:hypothetical protein
LFLVCRLLCRDAQFVFFSGNRFIVHDFHALMPCDLPDVQDEPYYPHERLLASEFLKDIIPVYCLADLRFLELVFPPYEPDGWPDRKRATISDWWDTVDWVRDKINAPALTLSIVMADLHGDNHNLRQRLTKDEGHQIVKGYSSILRCLGPLARDGGLGGFHIQPAYPWRWNPGAIRNMKGRHEWPLEWHNDWVAKAARRFKEHAEKYVFGGEHMDSRNKAEPRKSSWQRWYEVPYTCSHMHWKKPSVASDQDPTPEYESPPIPPGNHAAALPSLHNTHPCGSILQRFLEPRSF